MSENTEKQKNPTSNGADGAATVVTEPTTNTTVTSNLKTEQTELQNNENINRGDDIESKGSNKTLETGRNRDENKVTLTENEENDANKLVVNKVNEEVSDAIASDSIQKDEGSVVETETATNTTKDVISNDQNSSAQEPRECIKGHNESSREDEKEQTSDQSKKQVLDSTNESPGKQESSNTTEKNVLQGQEGVTNSVQPVSDKSQEAVPESNDKHIQLLTENNNTVTKDVQFKQNQVSNECQNVEEILDSQQNPVNANQLETSTSQNTTLPKDRLSGTTESPPVVTALTGDNHQAAANFTYHGSSFQGNESQETPKQETLENYTQESSSENKPQSKSIKASTYDAPTNERSSSIAEKSFEQENTTDVSANKSNANTSQPQTEPLVQQSQPPKGNYPSQPLQSSQPSQQPQSGQQIQTPLHFQASELSQQTQELQQPQKSQDQKAQEQKPQGLEQQQEPEGAQLLPPKYQSVADVSDDEGDVKYLYEQIFAHLDEERLVQELATKTMIEKEDEESQKLQSVADDDSDNEKEPTAPKPRKIDPEDILPIPADLSPITNREKQGLLMKNFSSDQSTRYEAYKRSALSKSFIKKISLSILGQNLPAPVHYAISGVAKYFAMEILEKAKDIYDADVKVRMAEKLNKKRAHKFEEYQEERENRKKNKVSSETPKQTPISSIANSAQKDERSLKAVDVSKIQLTRSPFTKDDTGPTESSNKFDSTKADSKAKGPFSNSSKDSKTTEKDPFDVKMPEKPPPLLPSQIREAFRLYMFENQYPTNNWRQQGEGNGFMFR